MISLSRLRGVSLLFLGLTLTACSGGQTESSAGGIVAGFETTTTPTTSTTAVPSEGSDPEAVPDGLPLSDLAAGVVELPSAFPERVLDGLGEPIGRPPATLSLPSLGKDAALVVPVGLEPNGELEVPGADDVGWYQFGAGVDGGVGSTVLAAHIAFDGRNGVFSDLAETKVGDEIVVGLDDSELVYTVVSIDQYNKLDLPIGDLFSESSEERIVLITCGGSFNPGLRSYDDNVVVVALPS